MYLNIFKIYNSSILTNDFIFKTLIELEINNIPIYKLNFMNVFHLCQQKTSLSYFTMFGTCLLNYLALLINISYLLYLSFT